MVSEGLPDKLKIFLTERYFKVRDAVLQSVLELLDLNPGIIIHFL